MTVGKDGNMKKRDPLKEVAFDLEALTGIEPVNGGFADLCLTAWLQRRGVVPARPRGQRREY